MKTNPAVLRATFGLSLLAFMPGCVSVQPVLKATPSAAIANRLPALEVAADQGPLAMNDGAMPEDPLNVFKQECRVNLAEPTDSAAYGYARFVIKKVNTTRVGRGLQAAQMATLLVPSVFGIPLEWYRTSLVAEVQITNADGEVLGTYTGTGNSNVKVAMYHGYSQSDAPRLADVMAMRNALAQIRPQLDTASARLRPLLMAGGTVENPTLSSSAKTEGQ